MNITARLQALRNRVGSASLGMFTDTAKGLALTFTDLGQQTVKNIEEGVRAYKVEMGPDLTAPDTREAAPPPR